MYVFGEGESPPRHIMVKLQNNQRENLKSSQRKGAFKGAIRVTADFLKQWKLKEGVRIVYVKGYIYQAYIVNSVKIP